MKTAIIALIILVLLALAGWFYVSHQTNGPAVSQTATTTTTTATQAQTVTTPAGVSFSYADPYGLATSPDQILVKSYIPACTEGFDYCLYRTGTQYAGTNFESAGLAVKTRSDLTTKSACLTAQPAGYTGLHATTTDAAAYATSVIGPTGDAGAGHYATGNVYRLWSGSTCTEFTAQIGETQFANYPAGTKTEFTAADRASVMAELTGILAGVMLNGAPVSFPH